MKFTALSLAAAVLVPCGGRAQDPPRPTTVPAAAKPAKEAAVYDESADAKKDVAVAVAKAKRDHKRVLIQWGANWCGWCKWLAGTMKSDADLARKLRYEYQVVHVDVGRFDKHKDLAQDLGAQFKSIPYLTILDADGKPVTQQNTEPFEIEVDGKSGHDAKKLLAWLTEHQAEPQDAAAVVAAALAEAKRADKRVFLHFGAPWCGWCHRLEDWMARPETASVLGKDFVDVKVDIDRMTNGKLVYHEQLAAAGHGEGGIPWFVFLDTAGKQVAESNGSDGNVGFPYAPPEIAHFVTMLQAAKVRMTDADIDALRQSLDENRQAEEHKQAPARGKDGL